MGEKFAPDWLSEPLVVDGEKIAELLQDPATAKGKYIRLFTAPSLRSAAHMQDFIVDCTSLTMDQVDELTMTQIQDVFQQIVEAIKNDAINPTTEGQAAPATQSD